MDAHEQPLSLLVPFADQISCNYHTGRPHPVPDSLRHAFEQMEGEMFPRTKE
jgi:acyl-CoA thioester hydrolase